MAKLGVQNQYRQFLEKINHESGCGSNFLGRSTDEYEVLNVIGCGSYGVVYRAADKKSGEIVAMKKEVRGFCRSTMREIIILKCLPRHPSVVEFKQVIEDRDGSVFVVMEYLPTDLKRFMNGMTRHFTVVEVKRMMKQILEGVIFLHENGVMHRDLKPSNILMSTEGQMKICDFGISRSQIVLDSGSGSGSGTNPGRFTSGVGSLWYKAPEILLGVKRYSSAIDMWSAGCIMAELVMLKEVLFRGKSKVHQLGCIHQLLEGSNVLRLKLSVAASFSGAPLLSPSGFDLVERLLAFDPNKRISAQDARNHAWFKEY